MSRDTWLLIRDIVLFAVGLAGVIHEAGHWVDEPRTVLLILFGAMMGIPAFSRIQDWRKNGNGK